MAVNPFESMTDMLKDIQKNAMGSMNSEALMKSHRRNLEALTEANHMAVEVMKSIAKMQSQYIKQSFEDMSSIMKGVVAQPKGEKPAMKDVLNRNADIVKDQVHRAFEHSSNVTDLISRSQREMFDRMQERYQEGASEIIEVSKASRTKH